MYSRIKYFFKDTSGAAIVELTMVSPLLFALTFGVIAYGYLFGVYSSVQHIAAEAARASIAGVDDLERDALARSFVTANAGSYSFLDAARMTVVTGSAGGSGAPTFEVLIRYDISGSIADIFPLIPIPPSPLTLRAAVQRGGY